MRNRLQLVQHKSQKPTNELTTEKQNRKYLGEMDAEFTTTKRALRSTAKKQPTSKPKQHAVQQGGPIRNTQKRWSEEERNQLLKALETYGPRELESIAEMVGTRSRDEVMCAIKYWKKESANQSMKVTFNRKNFNKSGVGRMRNCQVVNGVELWIEVMLKHGGKTGGKEAILAIADVVKCIACFEALPTVEEADGIDFRELYLWLAEMLNGQPIRSLSLATSAFLTQCSRDLSKQAADNLWPRTKSALSRIVDNVWCPQNVKTYSKRDPPPVKNSFINERMQALLTTPGINPIGLDKERLPFKQLLG